jgi:alkylation response protein AidB-like acyl-CoA dehydrogenase
VKHLAAAQSLRAALADDAARVEREGVTRDDLKPLVDAGLYGLYAPPELGGSVSAAEQREVAELLAGAGQDVWFVWFQHSPVLRMTASTANTSLRDRYVVGLASGELIGGVSYSHLRNDKPGILATRDGDDYLLSGRQAWVTGWGINDLIVVGAVVPESDEIVFGLIPSGDSPGATSAGLLELAAMNGTVTHAVAYDGHRLPADHVLNVLPRKDFLAVDAISNANVQPSTLGIALAALDLFDGPTHDVLHERVLTVRSEAYRLLDEVPAHEQLEERLALRAQALLLGIECSTALLTSSGGKGMGLNHPAQRLLRAASFQVIHSQAAGIKAATLAALAS